MFCLVWGPFPRSFACQYSVLICHLEGSEPIQGSAALASPPLALPGSDFPIVISANTDTEASDKDGGETTEKKKKKRSTGVRKSASRGCQVTSLGGGSSRPGPQTTLAEITGTIINSSDARMLRQLRFLDESTTSRKLFPPI